jgi:hypothetical protein
MRQQDTKLSGPVRTRQAQDRYKRDAPHRSNRSRAASPLHDSGITQQVVNRPDPKTLAIVPRRFALLAPGEAEPEALLPIIRGQVRIGIPVGLILMQHNRGPVCVVILMKHFPFQKLKEQTAQH